MKVLLKEHYNDASHALTPGQQVEVDDTLGAWLVEHRKAVKIEEAKAEVTALSDTERVFLDAVEPVEEPHPVDEPVEEVKPKRGKRGKQ